jgi:hypothetical protein
MTSERELELAFEYRDTLSSLRLNASDVERVERVGKRRRIIIHTRDGRALRVYDLDNDSHDTGAA